MTGIIIATHGDLSLGFLESIDIIMGSQEMMETVSLKNETGIEGFKKELGRAINKLSPKDGLLIMTDLKGGTPYNCSLYCSQSREYPFEIKVVCGVNLPMLLETLAFRDSVSLSQLVNIAITAGKDGIDFSIDADEEEDEEL